MAKKKPAKDQPAKLRPDAAETAFRVYQEAIGENPKTLPPSERAVKNEEAVKRGRKGGEKGGSARKAKTTADQRAQDASNAARARWQDKKR